MLGSKLSKALSAAEIQRLLTLLKTDLSSRKIAKELQQKISKSMVNYLREKLREEAPKAGGPKVLLLDIETTPEISFTWGRWKQYVSQEQIIQHPYILTYAVRWMHTGETISKKTIDFGQHDCDRALVTDLWAILMEADIIVAHNGDKFDIPWILARAIKYGLPPLNPTKFVDTLKFAKKNLRLPSNSLDSITKYYGLRPKLGNAGFPLWRACMDGNTQAFLDMETYNRGDLDALEDVYLLFRPYMKGHPNVALYYPDRIARCAHCGSSDLHEEEALYHTSISSFGTVRCGSCGAVHRTRKNVRTSEQMAQTIIGV